MLRRSICILVAALLPVVAALADEPKPGDELLPPPEPARKPSQVPLRSVPYRILLRSRHGHVMPTTTSTRRSQTAGGFIDVAEVEPNTVAVLMRGAVVAGGDWHPSVATMQFELSQDFEIVPTRPGLRPPRLIMAGRVVGTLLTSTAPNGSAEQAPACASVRSGGNDILGFCVSQHGATGGENLSLNCREGPVEGVVVPGLYCLHSTFGISASLPRPVKHRPDAAVVADFDPRPQIDTTFYNALKPFRAVPRQEFGFRLVVRVVEDTGFPARPNLAPRAITRVPVVEIQP